jgi:hypothetical protein
MSFLKTTLASTGLLFRRNILSTGLLAMTFAFATDTADAKMYRWVDEDGKVHYSDQVPPSEAKQARSELNSRGIEVDRVEAAKTPEEIARQRELEKLRAEQQRLIEKQEAEDRVLLATFRSEDDIIMARDGKITAVTVMISILRNNIKNAKARLAELQMVAAERERSGKKIFPITLQQIEERRNQIKESYASILQREQEQEEIRKKFQYDLDRFRILKNLKPGDEVESEEEREGTLLETVILCENKASCDALWKQAEEYLKIHATTQLQLIGKNIMMTKAPLKDNDISITISRIANKDDAGLRLFMDLQCKNSPRGKDLCHSDKVRKIRTDFRHKLLGSTE